MKNSILFFALTTLLFFASCTKDSILQPEQDLAIDTDKIAMDFSSPSSEPEVNSIGTNSSSATVEVTKTSYSISGNQLTVDFTSNHDFTEEDLEAIQSLDFTDGEGKASQLDFGVQSHSGADGSLQVIFSIGGNDLNGLGMDVAQGIITEDIIIN